MSQCHGCQGYLFFTPFPGDTFACCSIRKENVKDISLRTGLSPAIQKYGQEEIPCLLMKPGKSVCVFLDNQPFALSQTRKEGEEYLRKSL